MTVPTRNAWPKGHNSQTSAIEVGNFHRAVENFAAQRFASKLRAGLCHVVGVIHTWLQPGGARRSKGQKPFKRFPISNRNFSHPAKAVCE